MNPEDMSYLKERLKEINAKVFIVTDKNGVDSIFTNYDEAYNYTIKNNFDLRIKTYIINEKVEQ